MSEEWKQIEAVLDEKVRPSLRAHGGELEIDHLEGGVLYIKLLGQCAGCPSADLTNETLIEHELTAALPELVQNCNKIIVMRDGKVEAAVDNSIDELSLSNLLIGASDAAKSAAQTTEQEVEEKLPRKTRN